MPARKQAKLSSPEPNPTALVAAQIRSEVHLCPRCWAPVVRLVDLRAPEASKTCHCRHFHTFEASPATLAPRVKSAPPPSSTEECEAPTRRRSSGLRVA
jgi:hypothetical protein